MKDQNRASSLEHSIAVIIAASPSPQLALLPAVQRLVDEVDGGRAFVGRLAVMCEVSESVVQSLLEEYCSPGRSVETGRLCVGLSCVLNGAQKVLKYANEGHEKCNWMGPEITTVGCLGRCFAAPVFEDSTGRVHHIDVTAME